MMDTGIRILAGSVLLFLFIAIPLVVVAYMTKSEVLVVMALFALAVSLLGYAVSLAIALIEMIRR